MNRVFFSLSFFFRLNIDLNITENNDGSRGGSNYKNALN